MVRIRMIRRHPAPMALKSPQQFLAAQNLPGTARVLKNAKDQVNACIELRTLQQANLSVYLKK